MPEQDPGGNPPRRKTQELSTPNAAQPRRTSSQTNLSLNPELGKNFHQSRIAAAPGNVAAAAPPRTRNSESATRPAPEPRRTTQELKLSLNPELGQSFHQSRIATVPPSTASVAAQRSPSVERSAAEAQRALDASSFTQRSGAWELRHRLPSAFAGPASVAGAPEADAEVPPDDLTTRDVWKAIRPTVTSTADRRSPIVYARVIQQFEVDTNPRYDPDAPDKPRAHIFVWDVTRAMGAEVPHFAGMKELSLAQTCDWIRFEGVARGWLKLRLDRALNLANVGQPVLVLPENPKLKALAVLLPGDVPQVASAGLVRGGSLEIARAMPTAAVDCFVHP